MSHTCRISPIQKADTKLMNNWNTPVCQNPPNLGDGESKWYRTVPENKSCLPKGTGAFYDSKWTPENIIHMLTPNLLWTQQVKTMPPETNPEGFVWIPEIMIVKEGEQGVVWFVLHCPVSHNTESSFPCSLRDTATLKSKVKSFWFSMIADASLSCYIHYLHPVLYFMFLLCKWRQNVCNFITGQNNLKKWKKDRSIQCYIFMKKSLFICLEKHPFWQPVFNLFNNQTFISVLQASNHIKIQL